MSDLAKYNIQKREEARSNGSPLQKRRGVEMGNFLRRVLFHRFVRGDDKKMSNSHE